MNDQTPPADCCALFRLVGQCHDVVGRVERELADLGLSLAKVGILRQLVLADEPLPLSVVADRVGCVKSNVSQLVDRMVADQLVARLADPADRRLVRATVTPSGLRAYGAASERLAHLSNLWAARVDGGPSAIAELITDMVAAEAATR
ncbi:MAG: MarR family transcriptional regulator [Gemmatimonadaceae bacterium]|nr:MarR family transcriptional regulator [Gemmatimonadaceae bacterium]